MLAKEKGRVKIPVLPHRTVLEKFKEGWLSG
jgi:hypothetical protein